MGWPMRTVPFRHGCGEANGRLSILAIGQRQWQFRLFAFFASFIPRAVLCGLPTGHFIHVFDRSASTGTPWCWAIYVYLEQQ